MKKLFIFFGLLCTLQALAVEYNFQATAFASQTKDSEEKWSEWSDWSESSVLIVYNMTSEKVTIFAKETLKFDVYDTQRGDDGKGGDTFELHCVDDNGLKCGVDLRNAKSGGLEIYVRYGDFNAVYAVNTPSNIRNIFPNYREVPTPFPATTNNSSTNAPSSSNYSGETTLSVSKSYISATAYGVIEYITVTSNRSWEIQYPSGGMYSARRDGNKVVVNISANTTYGSRSDFFNIRTTDGKKSIKITLSQAAGSSSSSSRSSSSYQRNRSRSYGQTTYSPSKYRQYINSQGIFEITWYSMRLGIGSGAAYSISPMKLRLGPVQLSPAEIAVGWDFLRSDLHANYQPTIDALIPVNQYSAIYAGIGPTIDIGDNDIWFKIEAGWHYHWGSSASSDFFLRYDGTFCVGTSIQWSTGW